MVEELPGEGELPTGDGLSPDGEGLSPDGDGLPAGDDESAAGDGESAAGDGESAAGDGESAAGDGDALPAGDGLSAAAQTLSAVVEPALLSTSVVALQVVQFVQVFWLDAVENFPVGQASQVRSVLLVPLSAIFWPAMQVVHAVQEKAGIGITSSAATYSIVKIGIVGRITAR